MENLSTMLEIATTVVPMGGVVSVIVYLFLTRKKRRAETNKIKVEASVELNSQAIKLIKTLGKQLDKQDQDIKKLRGEIRDLRQMIKKKDGKIADLNSKISIIASKCPSCPIKETIFNPS